MNRDRAYKILELEGHKNIVKVVKPSGYFLDEHSHDFDVDLIVLSGKLEVVMSDSSVILTPGSRFKLKKHHMHSERSGSKGVIFLSARP